MSSFITTDYVMGFAIGFCIVVLIALVARAAGDRERPTAAAGAPASTPAPTTAHDREAP